MKKLRRKLPAWHIQNPTSYYLRNCVYEIYNTEDRIANQIEVAKVVKKLRSDYKQKPDYIVPYAVELAMYTGMRVGEISALTWDSIKDNVIIINKEEIYDRIENKYYIVNYSKNKKKTKYFYLIFHKLFIF